MERSNGKDMERSNGKDIERSNENDMESNGKGKIERRKIKEHTRKGWVNKELI